MSTVVIKRYVGGLEGRRRLSIRKRSDGNFQVYDDNRYEGINQPYEFEQIPISGLFADFASAEEELLRTHAGFEPEP